MFGMNPKKDIPTCFKKDIALKKLTFSLFYMSFNHLIS